MAEPKSPLRAVGDDETVPAKPRTVAQAAKTGDQRVLLVAMRDRVAESVSSGDCQPRDLAALTKRLQDIVRDIAALDAIEEGEQAADIDTPIDNSFDSSAI